MFHSSLLEVSFFHVASSYLSIEIYVPMGRHRVACELTKTG